MPRLVARPSISRREILPQGGFIPPEEVQLKGAPTGQAPWGRGCDIDKPRNLAKSVTVE